MVLFLIYTLMCFGGQRKGMYGNKPSQKIPVRPDEALRFGRQNSFWGEMRVISGFEIHFGAKRGSFRSSKIILGRNAMLFSPPNSADEDAQSIVTRPPIFAAIL